MNALLASLTSHEWEVWEPYFERVKLNARQEYLAPDDPCDHLWFPEGGIHSQVVESADGRSVEVAVVGHEGMVGLPAVFGSRQIATRSISQMETTAMRISVDDFVRHLHGEHPLLHRLERYAAVTLCALAQIAGATGSTKSINGCADGY